MYAIILLDGIRFNIMQDGQATKKTVYVVYGINVNGMKEVLRIWIGEAESAKFWMKVFADIKNRGVQDILIASVDGLKGFEEAITSTFPKYEVQQCIVHQVRYSTMLVNYKDRKEFCEDMKTIYTSPNEPEALRALDAFAEKWESKYAYAIRNWRNNWSRLSTFFKYPPEIRRLIYTTNAIENFNRQIRKVTKNKSSFASDDALLKVLYLVVMDRTSKWTLPIQNWAQILQQLEVYYTGRITAFM